MKTIQITRRIVSADNALRKWVLSDFELLGTEFERTRQDISGQPQTVILSSVDNGIIPASGDYKRITRELNPGMDDSALTIMMDRWTPDGAKWRDGEEKVPCRIIFASNPIHVLGLVPNPGGLTGIPAGVMVYQLDMLDYDTLFMYNAATIPEKYIMHLTVNKNGSDVVNPSPDLGGRNGLPVKLLITSNSQMFIRPELLSPIGIRTNRYNPPWEKGVI